MQKIISKKELVFLLFLFGISAFFRFYHLTWGAPFYFHPDERNIAYALIQLSFPAQMNPHFFAYGSFPIYTLFFFGNFFSFLLNKPFDLSFAILMLRIASAILSLSLIPSLFLIAKSLFNTRIAYISTFLTACSVGFIQFAHFGTFEMWLTCFSLWLFYVTVMLSKKSTLRLVFLAGLLMGLLSGTKISSLVLLPLPLLGIWIGTFQGNSLSKKQFLQHSLFFLLISFFIYSITNPFIYITTNEFLNSIRYESSVALGTLPVFYTGEFLNTIPIFYQFTKIYPFLLNPFITFLFIPAFFFVLYKSFKQKQNSYLFLVAYYLILLLSQAFLFVKWTRYMVPTLPFMYLILSLSLEKILNKKTFLYSFCILLFAIALLYSVSFMKTVYGTADTREIAAMWAHQHISPQSIAVTEPYDLGTLPFNQVFPSLTTFNFYELDTNPNAEGKLSNLLTYTQTLVLPSQRLLRNRLINKTFFSKGYFFYSHLLNESLGFKKIYQTPCDMWCTITYMGDPLFHVEETANVFDRPTIFLFSK